MALRWDHAELALMPTGAAPSYGPGSGHHTSHCAALRRKNAALRRCPAICHSEFTMPPFEVMMPPSGNMLSPSAAFISRPSKVTYHLLSLTHPSEE